MSAPASPPARRAAAWLAAACLAALAPAAWAGARPPPPPRVATASLEAPNADVGDQFGASLALAGATLAVGAPGGDGMAAGVFMAGDLGLAAALASDREPGWDSGAAHVFRRAPDGRWAAEAYLKAPGGGAGDEFGAAAALSADGGTLAVGAPWDDSAAAAAHHPGDPGFGAALASDTFQGSGAAYIYRAGADGRWALEAYLKAPGESRLWGTLAFGAALALSGGGAALAVGAPRENRSATGVFMAGEAGFREALAGTGDPPDGAIAAGAVHVFRRTADGRWAPRAYLKAPVGGSFGAALALSGDGAALAIGAPHARGAAGRVLHPGDPGYREALASDGDEHSGVVYAYRRGPDGRWALETYFGPSDAAKNDHFGAALALSGDGAALAVGAPGESSAARGSFMAGDPGWVRALESDAAWRSGAVYVHRRGPDGRWALETYLKAPNAAEGGEFGASVALSADGATLATGAPGEAGSAIGVLAPGGPGFPGALESDAAWRSGAVYVHRRGPDGRWALRAYAKSPGPGEGGSFGAALALSAVGATLAAGAPSRWAWSIVSDGGFEWGMGSEDAPAVRGWRHALASGAGHVTGSGGAYLHRSTTAAPWPAGPPPAASAPVPVEGPWPRGAPAYLKAPSADAGDHFGTDLALSADGATLAAGAVGDDSSATGAFHPGDPRFGAALASDGAGNSGAVHIFRRGATGRWASEAYLKAPGADGLFGIDPALSADGAVLAAAARGGVHIFRRGPTDRWAPEARLEVPNAGKGDGFGAALALSADGAVLVVGASYESSSATGAFHPGDPGFGAALASDGAGNSGAAHVFRRGPDGRWALEAYVKAPNAREGDWFGASVALSGDGATLAAGATGDDSSATGAFRPGDPGHAAALAAGGATQSGAAHVFRRGPDGRWAAEAYLKAPKVKLGDDWFGERLGNSLALSADGTVLAVGSSWEDGSAVGAFHPGDPGFGASLASDPAGRSGAVHVFRRRGGRWALEAYVKAPNAAEGGEFGAALALSADGAALAVGAVGEASAAKGVFRPLGPGWNRALADRGFPDSGAVHVFRRGPDGRWASALYLKAPNAGKGDEFGASVALSADGAALAVGARGEDGSVRGALMPGDPGWRAAMERAAARAEGSGAAYLYPPPPP